MVTTVIKPGADKARRFLRTPKVQVGAALVLAGVIVSLAPVPFASVGVAALILAALRLA
jgi:hypothetical protein